MQAIQSSLNVHVYEENVHYQNFCKSDFFQFVFSYENTHNLIKLKLNVND